ncbi:MAG: helix-turn-helix domain-containing protein [Pseudomonadota bacterium]
MKDIDHDLVSRSPLTPYDPETCPIRLVLDGLGNKWSVLVLVGLWHERLRFGELRHLIPDISQKMLTQVLRALERDGLVARDDRGGFPRVVYYTLTPLGDTLMDPLMVMSGWARDNLPQIKANRRAYDAGAV